MDQRLINSDAHHAKDPYHGREGHIDPHQRKQANRTTNRQENTGDDHDSIFEIIKLHNKNQDHQDQSDKHCRSHIAHTLGKISSRSSGNIS